MGWVSLHPSPLAHFPPTLEAAIVTSLLDVFPSVHDVQSFAYLVSDSLPAFFSFPSTFLVQALRSWPYSNLDNYIFSMQIAPLNLHRQADGGPATVAASAALL